MWFAGFSLDNLSLMALTIGTGFVVDDAIVMIENIVRHIEDGEPPLQAALKGAREIGFTVISLTVSLIAVFIPLLFMSGLVGRMFREFALTLTIAVVVSAIVSLTLTPMMCARLLKARCRRRRRPAGRVEHWIDCARLPPQPRWRAATASALMLLVMAATLAATVWLYIIVPKGFLPLQDTGLDHRRDAGRADRLLRGAEGAPAAASPTSIARDPDVTGVVSVVGVGAADALTQCRPARS